MDHEPSSTQSAFGDRIAQADRGGTAMVITYEIVAPRPVDGTTLADAENLLASLPLDGVPPPAALPAGSRMPYARNALFVGRDQELRSLAAVLKGGGTAAIGQIAAATGLGGIGKTQLAIELAHRYGRFFAGGVFWLSCADAAVVPGEVVACGGAGALDLRPDFAILKQEDQVALVLAVWQSPLPRLLVFDNCEEPALLAGWRPPTGGARVLVTSRRSSWEPALGVEALRLDILPRAESVALLCKFRPELAADDAGLADIAAELGDLPLALHLAGSYLHAYRFSEAGSPAALLAELRRPGLLNHPALQGLPAGLSPTGHEHDVARTFAVSYRRLDANDPGDALAIRALARAACFAPGEPIPRELLKKTFAPPGDSTGELAAEGALHRLSDLGLLGTEGDGNLRLHRLLARFAVSLGADPEAADAVEAALFDEAARINEAGFPEPLHSWQTHLRWIAETARVRGAKRAASLWNELGHYLLELGATSEARQAYKTALEIDESSYGFNHPKTSIALNNLGHALELLGEFQEARSLLERALRMDEASFGPDHPDVATRADNLGSILMELGDLQGARAAHERALRINEAAYGTEHSEVVTSLNNLSATLRELGHFKEAVEALTRAVRIQKNVLRSDHPSIAITLNNLGIVLADLRYLDWARSALVQAQRIGHAAYGLEHPTVVTYTYNLGRVLQDIGDCEGARAAFTQVLRIREATLGLDHPKTRLVQENLAALGHEP